MSKNEISLSVVICTYNRVRFLPSALESLAKQSEDNICFEIVIVNNNSTDKTEEVSLNFISKYPNLSVTYCVEKQAGLSFARNRGISESKGKFISFIDDDAIAREDYVENLLKSFKLHPGFGAIGGKVIPIYGTGKEPKWMNKYIQGVVSKVDYGDKVHDFNKKYPVGCNMAFRKELFEKFGGFNTDLVYRGDDKFVFVKLKKNGVKVLYDPNIYVNHYIDSYRLEKEFINKISKSSGASERLRLQDDGLLPNSMKLVEFAIKLGGSFVLLLMFSVKGEYLKGEYCVRVMWNTILGYFSGKKSASL